MTDDDAPIGDDLRLDDEEYNPAVEPNKSKAWLNLLLEAEDAFGSWHDHCDNIDKLYASLDRLASNSVTGRAIRDKQFAMFWANCEVIKPSIYAKPPVPVVVPKFKDRRPVYQAASEFMERCCIVSFDLTRINDLMLLVRDDVAMIGRGVAWARYESAGEGYYASERVCIDFKGRRDFLHSLSRNWREVTWVAGASYLTRGEARKRFHQHSGNAYQDADYKVDKESQEVGGGDNRERAAFWEIWDKNSRRVLWVAHGVDEILDEDEPHLELAELLPLSEAGLRHHPARQPDPGARRDAVQGPARRDQPVDRAHSRLERCAGSQRLLPGRRRRDRRRGRDRGQDPQHRRACWCRSPTGPRSARPRTSSSGCRST